MPLNIIQFHSLVSFILNMVYFTKIPQFAFSLNVIFLNFFSSFSFTEQKSFQIHIRLF